MHSPSLNIGNYGLLCWNSPIASRYRQRHCLCCVEIVNSILPIVKLWKRTTARTLKLQTIPACKLLQTIDWRCPRCLRRKHGEGGNGARYHHPLWYLYSNRGGYLGSVNDERESLRTVWAPNCKKIKTRSRWQYKRCKNLSARSEHAEPLMAHPISLFYD